MLTNLRYCLERARIHVLLANLYVERGRSIVSRERGSLAS